MQIDLVAKKTAVADLTNQAEPESDFDEQASIRDLVESFWSKGDIKDSASQKEEKQKFCGRRFVPPQTTKMIPLQSWCKEEDDIDFDEQSGGESRARTRKFENVFDDDTEDEEIDFRE